MVYGTVTYKHHDFINKDMEWAGRLELTQDHKTGPKKIAVLHCFLVSEFPGLEVPSITLVEKLLKWQDTGFCCNEVDHAVWLAMAHVVGYLKPWYERLTIMCYLSVWPTHSYQYL